MYRFFRWLGWSVVLSLLPFAALLGFRFFESGEWPGLTPILGAGQLLLTGVAILGGGVRELVPTTDVRRAPARGFLFWASFLFAIAMIMSYGYLANDAINNRTLTPSDQEVVVIFSVAMFAMSAAVAAAAIFISGPTREAAHA